MNRLVIFAHYDKDCIVDDYVVYYLKALKEVASDIVFVSCNKLENKEILDNIVTVVIDDPHNEYDFGSYKRGYLYAKDNLDKYDEIIFANDSCFGPFYPLKSICDNMSERECDFWGITKNNFGIIYIKKPLIHPHIQSYFIVFKKQVFTSEVFADYINSIKEEENKKSVIEKYEIGLSDLLVKNGFKYDSYINAYKKVNNIPILRWYQIILNYNMPFMKTSLIKHQNVKVTTISGFEDVISKVSDYPISLITNYMTRYGIKYKKCSKIFTKFKRFAFFIASFSPIFVRRFLNFVFGFFLKKLKD